MPAINPVYLFADSQPLFWKNNGQLFIKNILSHVSAPEPTAAYVGYANGNQAEFYEIFQSVMASIGIQTCQMLDESYTKCDRDFIATASVILLAGGDPLAGWKKIVSTGLKDDLLKRFSEGAVLLGVSAGAVHLGLSAQGDDGDDSKKGVDTLQIVPFIVSAHDEANEWSGLKSQVLSRGEFARGVGIPFGSGFIYHPDHTIEPIKGSIVEIGQQNCEISINILFPEADQVSDTVLQ
jgi:peptidase E